MRAILPKCWQINQQIAHIKCKNGQLSDKKDVLRVKKSHFDKELCCLECKFGHIK